MAKLRTRPPLFRSKKTQTTTNSVKKNVTNDSLGDHDFSSDNFLLDSYAAPFKSTQQLNIDFSKFQNHTFFSPARAKVDIALHKCINEFPYTGSKANVERFITRLTGFEKYVFDQIPKNKGFLFFSGSQGPNGSYISVSPFAGNEFFGVPGATGENFLNVDHNPFEIETHLYIPEILNDNQVICQRSQTKSAFTLALSSSSQTDQCKIIFLVSSASDSYVIASGSCSKGQFSHVRACLEKENGGKKAKIYVNNLLIASSSDIQDFGSLVFDTANFNIGSGSTHSILDYSFSPVETLSGALDEFRFFTDQRDQSKVELQQKTQIFATSSLGLYFRFDEPSGSYDMRDVVLDYSGHCLHSRIQNYSESLRVAASISNPMTLQDAYFSPVLYPDYDQFENLINRLLSDSESYDAINPNNILSLVPLHYLEESALASGSPQYDSGIGIAPKLASIPGTGELHNSSPLLRILVIMSISLDEIKQFADDLSKVLAIEPGSDTQISGQMIRYAADYFGITLPNFFAKSTVDQFSFGEDIEEDVVTRYTLRGLRDDLWRRILYNMPYIVSSKGTRGAVRSILLSSGIVPENFFVIRELGMAGETRIKNLRDKSEEVISVLDFSGSILTPTGVFVSPGVMSNSPRIISPFLSASRVEIGFPDPVGTFVNKSDQFFHGISNSTNDGLLTSGSFSIDASFIFDKRLNHPSRQSLFRLLTTGSSLPRDFLVANVFFDRTSDETGNLTLALNASAEIPINQPKPLILFVSGVNLFDGERWTVGIERKRADEAGFLSSSYTLRCARQVGENVTFFKDAAFYSETSVSPGLNVFQNLIPTFNASGTYTIVGSQSFSASTRFLNSYSDYITSRFTGKISGIRFQSQAIGDASFIERSRNFASIGTSNPEIGLGFDLVQTGAFQRLRIDASCDQATTASDGSGNIRIFDFSQNSMHFLGSGFSANTEIIKPQTVYVDRVSPRFDLQQVYNKVRVRGLNNPAESDPDYIISGPAYEIYDTTEIVDDTRFSIEHSVVKALNEDVISTIGDVQYLEDVLGQPRDFFNDSYSRIDHFSDVYFNRLTGKMDLARTYDVFRWVDVALTDIVESVLPKRTKFLGINYIIEPHILERAKVKYRFDQMFMLTNDMVGLKYEDVVLDYSTNILNISSENIDGVLKSK